MDRNESYDLPAIDSSFFFYLCDHNGHAICNKRFPTSQAAKTYYKKAHKKVPEGCFIGRHTADIVEDSYIE